MPNEPRGLAPPRAAAVAGVIFSLLMGVSLIIVRLAVPSNQTGPGDVFSRPNICSNLDLFCTTAHGYPHFKLVDLTCPF